MHRTAVARGDALHHPSVAVVAGDVDGGVLQLVLDVELENLRILLLTGIGTNFRIVGLTRQAFPVILIFQNKRGSSLILQFLIKEKGYQTLQRINRQLIQQPQLILLFSMPLQHLCCLCCLSCLCCVCFNV